MKKTMKRLLALLLTLGVVLGAMSVGAFATQEEAPEPPASAVQVVKQGGTSSANGVTISKTIEGTEHENVFDITLTVETSKTVEEIYTAQDAAVVMVMDVSNTMNYKMGASNDAGNGATSNDIRYDAAIAAAESFINAFQKDAAETGSDMSRRIGFVAFNTSATQIFGLSECSEEAEAQTLINSMKTGTAGILKAANYQSSVSRFTNIEAGLSLAQSMLSAAGESNKYIIFLSDGFPTTYSTTVGGTTGYNPYMSQTYNPGFVADDSKIGTAGYFYNQKTGELCIDGTNYSDMGATRAQNVAAAIKGTGTKIYSVGVGLYQNAAISGYASYLVDCYPGDGYVIGDNTASFETWLRNAVGSNSYADCANAEDLENAFSDIFEDIQETSMEAVAAKWVTTDPMNSMSDLAIDFLQFYNSAGVPVSGDLAGAHEEGGEDTASFANDAITWDLKHSGYAVNTDGETTRYLYTLKYRVRLMNEVTGFAENDIINTNGTTTLAYQVNNNGLLSDGTLTFEVPQVKGYLGEFHFTKTDTAGNPLAGAVFALTHNADCHVCAAIEGENPVFTAPAYTAVSDENGRVSFAGIASGHGYTMTEIEAPDGYERNTASYPVEVRYDETTVNGCNTDETGAVLVTTPGGDAEAEPVAEPFAVVNPELNSLTIEKVVEVDNTDDDGLASLHEEDFTAEDFTFAVYNSAGTQIAELTLKEVTVGEGDSAETVWRATLNDLPADTYTVEETTAPQVDGYQLTVTYTGNGAALYDGTSATVGVTNAYTYVPEKVDVNVSKNWSDGGNQDGIRPASVTIHLLADGEATDRTLTLSADNQWHGAFRDLPKYKLVDLAGEEPDAEPDWGAHQIVYTISEDNVPGYTTEITADATAENSWTVTNSHTPEVVTVSGTKTWDDGGNRDGKRPDSITVNLFADGDKIESRTVTADDNGNWSYSFPNLPKYRGGQAITYTITEDAVTEYGTIITGYNITNTYTPGETSYTVTKIWDDANDQDGLRPADIQVQLLANGEAYGEPVTLSRGNWSYTWNRLPLMANGDPVSYSVDEVEVPEGYTQNVEGSIITNTHIPAETSVTVNKVWAASARGMEKEITVNLLADGEIIGTQTLSAANQWTYTWDGLPVNEAGKAIAYTVTEEALGAGWYQNITNDGNLWTVENSFYVPPAYTSRTVNKVWADDDDAAGLRPASVTVQLLKNGTAYGTPVTLNEDNGWTYTWERLEYSAAWSVEEVNVPEGYVSDVAASGTTFTVTNTLPTTEILEELPPTGDIPEEDIPTAEIPDEEIPLGEFPATGDRAKIIPVILALLASVAGLVFLWMPRKKTQK